MPGNTKGTKRRRWKRYKVKGGAIVKLNKQRLINLGKPRFIDVGPIIDISMGGIAVQYIEKKKLPDNCIELSVSVPDKGILLNSFPFNIVLDKQIALLPDGKKIRNRCVSFGGLTSYMKFQLETFLDSYTIDLISDRRGSNERRKFNDSRFKDPDYSVLYEKRSGTDRRLYVI